MLTLQSTFEYDEGSHAPVEYADVLLQYPQFSLGNGDNGGATSSLVFTGHGVTSFYQKLSSKQYSFTIPPSKIWGDAYGTTLSTYLLSLLRTNRAINPGDVSLSFTVRFGSEDTAATNTLDALYFFKLFTPKVLSRLPRDTPASSNTTTATGSPPTVIRHADIPDASRTTAASLAAPGPVGTGPTTDALSPDDLFPITPFPLHLRPINSNTGTRLNSSVGTNGPNQAVDANIYLVNRPVYQSFLQHLFPNLAPEKESVLLYLINALVDLTGSLPILSQDTEASRRKAVQDVLAAFTLDGPNVYDYLKANFAQLFDFPLKMPEFKLLTVAGTFGFSSGPANVPFNDFVFFRMSAEYQVAGADEIYSSYVSHYQWDPTKYQANKVGFSFTEQAIQNQVVNPVTIKIKAYDQSELYNQTFDPMDPILQNLNILVNLRVPPAISGSLPTDGSSSLKLRGKVVSLSKACTLKGTIVIQAKTIDTGPWITVATGTSDKAGNFTTPYPTGKYTNAQALVSLDAKSITTVKVDPQAVDNSISTDFLYLMVQGPQDTSTSVGTDGTDSKSADCNCNPQTTAGRLPSQDDLIQSDQYTQDVGGACINLTVPNRMLREFSYTALIRDSDPDVASYTLSSVEDAQYNEVYRLTPNGKIKRKMIDLDNPVRWQDGSELRTDLTVYQAVTVATGVILHYRSEFRADGYSLGDLVYSLPLAPGQKKQIVTIDARHAFVGSEAQNVSQSDSLANSLLSERNIVDQIGGNIGEALQGQSSASTSGISAGLGVAASAGYIGGSLGVAGGYSNSNSNASQNSKRDMSGFFQEVLRQSLTQNASDFRQLNATAVTTVQEGQSYQAETEVISNHNHCHSMTMLYFEVLRHFAIFQDLVDAEECVFVPLLMTRFTIENVGKWADLLAPRLLQMPSNTFMKPATFHGASPSHPLLSAFDALERVRTQWSLVDYPNSSYDEELIREVQGTVDLLVNIPRPKTKYDFILSFPIVTVTTTDTSGALNSFKNAVLSGGLSLIWDSSVPKEQQVEMRQKIYDELIQVDDNFQTVPPAQCIRIKSFKKFPVQGFTFAPMDYTYTSPIDTTMWNTYAALIGYKNPITAAEEFMEYYFAGQLIADWTTIFNDEVAPEIYKALIQMVSIDIAKVELTSLDPYKGGSRNMRAYATGQSSLHRKDFQYIKVYLNNPIPLALVGSPISFDLLSMRLTYATDHFNGLLFSGSVNTDLLLRVPNVNPPQSLGVTVFAPESADEKRNPRVDDQYLAHRLLQHLNSNLEYYNRALWSSFDRNRTFMLLDGFQIETFDQYGQSEGYRSLASVLKNQLISITGNSLVFPVAPGYRVSQTLIMRRDEGESDAVSLLDYYKGESPPPPYRLSVPTRGIYAEALMGQCDSCEVVKPDSSQDWTKFTTDEPTPINPLTAQIPTATQYNPQFKDFATPMVNIQNTPAQPDPGVGLAALTTLLGKSDIFKDITGLDANQKNAIQTLLSDNENAKAFAQMASSMLTQQHNTSNSPQIMDTIKKAQADGNLSKDSAQKLVSDHIQQSIDGGATMKSNLEKQRDQGAPSLSGAAVASAGKKGTAVSATRTVSDNNGTVSESVDIKPQSGSSSGSGGQSDSVAVVGTIEPLKQKTSDTCWATVATMMVSWLEKKSLAPEEVMRLAGDTYLQKYQTNQGLEADEKDAFLTSLGMVGEKPRSYTIPEYIAFMRNYGPVWVTVDSSVTSGLFSPHAKLLIGIQSDDTLSGDATNVTLLDPSQTKPAQVTQTFKDFLDSFEQAVTDNRSQTLYIQIVHFAERVAAPEGFEIEGPWNKGEPVHETIVLTSLMASDFHLPTTEKLGADQATNEFIRGVMWNDDPATLLFDDKTDDNWNFSSGILWYINFKRAPSPTNITSRSHNGDLQFFHAMGVVKGEAPGETLAKIKLWAEIMYRLSIGQGVAASDTIDAVTVSVASPSTTYTLKSIMDPAVPPTSTQTLQYLLTHGSRYTHIDMSRRSLGSLMHMIQDSFARGHCKRTLLNPGDLVPGSTTFQFKPGTYGKWGAVENFHSYPTQNHKAHAAFDDFDKDDMHPADPTSFNPLLGARDAIDRCTKLINFWVAKTPWENGPKALIENEIFQLSPAATPADDSV